MTTKLRSAGELLERNFSVLVGVNNSGKSRLLFDLYSGKIGIGRNALIEIISPDRFEFRDRSLLPYDDKKQREEVNKNRIADKNSRSSEVPPPLPLRDIANLPRHAREAMLDWYRENIGDIEIQQIDPRNEFSPRTLVFDGGREIQSQGTGSRSLIHLLSRLFDPEMVGLLLIDEPELGLYPSLQRKVMTLLQSFAGMKTPSVIDVQQFPVKKIILATHSHLFLDRINPQNNILVQKYVNDEVHDLQCAENEGDLHDLVYRQLGCSPVDLFMPRNVILVEGASDERFISRLLELKGISDIKTHYVEGCNRMRDAMLALEQVLKSLAYLPLYRKRGCMILDSNVQKQIVDQWTQYLGVQQVLHLSKPGIEYFYPRDVLRRLFFPSVPLNDVNIDSFLTQTKENSKGIGQLGSFEGTKVQLAECLTKAMTAECLREIDADLLQLLNTSDALSRA